MTIKVTVVRNNGKYYAKVKGCNISRHIYYEEENSVDAIMKKVTDIMNNTDKKERTSFFDGNEKSMSWIRDFIIRDIDGGHGGLQ